MQKEMNKLHNSLGILEQSAKEIFEKGSTTYNPKKFIELIRGLLCWHKYSVLSIVEIICNETDLNDFKEELLILAKSKDSFIRQEIAEMVIPKYKNLQDLGDFKILLSDKIKQVKHEAVLALWDYPFKEVFEYFFEGLSAFDKTHVTYCYEWFGQRFSDYKDNQALINRILESKEKVKGFATVGFWFFFANYDFYINNNKCSENEGLINLEDFILSKRTFRLHNYSTKRAKDVFATRSLGNIVKLYDSGVIDIDRIKILLNKIIKNSELLARFRSEAKEYLGKISSRSYSI